MTLVPEGYDILASQADRSGNTLASGKGTRGAVIAPLRNRLGLPSVGGRDNVRRVPSLSAEKRFAILCEIVRAQHFVWREAIAELCPDVPADEVATRMWQLTGVATGRAYAKHADPEAPLAAQAAQSVVFSSQCMGEDAVAEVHDAEAFVRHDDCPWYDWHDRKGLLAEDRPGCDAWFASTLETLGASMGQRIHFETLEALPEGGRCCRRRIWVDEE